MSLDELLQNPEVYRIRNYQSASHQVFHVRFEGNDYVVKKPYWNLKDTWCQWYYSVQERFLVGGRIVTTPSVRLQKEAQKLEEAAGEGMPRLVAYSGTVLVRDHVQGKGLGQLPSRRDKEKALHKVIYALGYLHERQILVGDAHANNIIIGTTTDHTVNWLPSGSYDESDALSAKAREVVKFIYSTYTVTRDARLTHWLAENLYEHYPDDEVKEKAAEMISTLNPGLGLWFSTRVRNSNVHNLIKDLF